MKKAFRIFSIFLILTLLFSVFSVYADNNDTQLISEDTTETITQDSQTPSYKTGDLYLFDEEITIDTPVDGNAFLFGNNVTINTEINGDVFVCANNIVIGENAIIYSNLFSISSNVEIKGIVNEAFSVAEKFSILGGYVYRDLKLACDTLNVYGSIGRNAFVACENINFDTEENYTSKIYGDLNYSSSSELTIPEGFVEGTTNFTVTNTSINENTSTQSIIISYIVDAITNIIFVLAIALVILWIAPKFAEKTKDIITNKKGSTIGFGLLGLFATPIACVILLILNVTSTVSLLLLAIYIIALILSKTIFTIVINNCICNKLKIIKKPATFGILSVTSLIIWAIGFIPYLGDFVSFALTVIGLGILILSIIPNKKNISTETNSIISDTQE